MAIDTAAKRFSMMDSDMPFYAGMDPPDGAVDAPDRATHLWLYNGIALASPAAEATGGDWILRVRRRRRS